MFKKFLKLNIVFISLFLFDIYTIEAYDFVNSSNQQKVIDKISEIYDSKEQYEDLVGGYEESIKNKVTSNMYWWPIGSKETRSVNGFLYADGDPVDSVVTSGFDEKEDFRTNTHGGVDISASGDINTINIIASKSGEVVYPIDKSQISFEDNGYYGNPDGGGYGNYVKIRHSDGTYTIYAHLAKNSITVTSGDVVDQGQVIAKMGNSGSSTGMHLHFEVRDANNNRLNPLQYISIDNPRSLSYSLSSFSLTATSLSKDEFKAKMEDYYSRTSNRSFYDNFLANADEIYDASLKYNVNPELVVVTAQAESGFEPCGNTNNYWGIGIANGEGCNSGPTFNSMSDGIEYYSKVLFEYTEQGSYSSTVTSRYNERESAGCDAAGHGLPGTVEGMQSLYSWIGDYRYNPGNSGMGGCYYLNIIYGENYCSTVSTCSDSSSCSEESRTTVCEQNDYTAWQLKTKSKIRYDIFGL